MTTTRSINECTGAGFPGRSCSSGSPTAFAISRRFRSRTPRSCPIAPSCRCAARGSSASWITTVAQGARAASKLGSGSLQRWAYILTHYQWIEPDGLQYFRNRLTQAPRDSEYALGLVMERCVTREWQNRAVAALNFKCDVLWSLLDAVERGKIPGGES